MIRQDSYNYRRVPKAQNSDFPVAAVDYRFAAMIHYEYYQLWHDHLPSDCTPLEWTRWSDFSECTRTCGVGRRTKSRECINNGKISQGCSGSSVIEENCNTISCPGNDVNLMLLSKQLNHEFTSNRLWALLSVALAFLNIYILYNLRHCEYGMVPHSNECGELFFARKLFVMCSHCVLPRNPISSFEPFRVDRMEASGRMQRYLRKRYAIKGAQMSARWRRSANLRRRCHKRRSLPIWALPRYVIEC